MDQYSSLSTQVLLFAVNRVTANADRWKWTATEAGVWVWSRKNSEWERTEKGQVTITMSDEDLREALVEHCESYDLTTRQINHMRS